MNALLPAVLLRGTQKHPDLRAITWHLDDLYGASAGTQVRRVGDYQTTGFYFGFIEDRYALSGDRILAAVVDFLRELLLEPVLEDGAFARDFVEGEKRNLIAAIEAQRNDKRVYASARMMELMCREDSFGIPRLGTKEDVAAITAQALYDHFRRILQQSRIDLFYVGSADPEQVAAHLRPLFSQIARSYLPLPAQTAFHICEGACHEETMEVAQGKLCMGLVTPITLRHKDFVAMQLCNTVLGGGMISKLFMQIREKMSLCYDISSGYHGSKGILTVAAGIDCAQETVVREEVMHQLAECQQGNITEEELTAAKQALLSSLRTVHDTPGAIESFYATAALSGLPLTVEAYMKAVKTVTTEQIARVAQTLQLHTVYFLRGE